MRTVIAGQSEPTQAQVEEGRAHNETWTWYPDDIPLRSLYGGDSRAALVTPGPHQPHHLPNSFSRWNGWSWNPAGMLQSVLDLSCRA
jgi:hypothetical protein